MMPTSHAPTIATLRIHSTALARVAQTLGPLWLVEGDCLVASHQSYADKLKQLEALVESTQAELIEIQAEASGCRDCAIADAEWDRFNAEQPDGDSLSALDRVIRAEKEAQDERAAKVERESFGPIDSWYGFTPDVDDAPTPAPEPFHSIHPSNCGCDGCVNRGLREVQDAVRRMPVATQAIDIRRPA